MSGGPRAGTLVVRRCLEAPEDPGTWVSGGVAGSLTRECLGDQEPGIRGPPGAAGELEGAVSRRDHDGTQPPDHHEGTSVLPLAQGTFRLFERIPFSRTVCRFLPQTHVSLHSGIQGSYKILRVSDRRSICFYDSHVEDMWPGHACSLQRSSSLPKVLRAVWLIA